jgi:hypothetical protein
MDHGVPQQVCQPPPVLIVGLVPAPVLDLLWVGQVNLYHPFQHVEHRFPIRTGAFHQHMRHALLLQPVPQLL